MARETKYTVQDLRRDFPTDDACLALLFLANHSQGCSCGGTYRRVKGRRQYQCGRCRFQIAPTAGTIFHKSDTPLTTWFHAIFVFAHAKSGVSAKELERQLGVTYKTAWRMLMLIRRSLGSDDAGTPGLGGSVEVDGGYFGGVKKGGKDNQRLAEIMAEKTHVLAAVERGSGLVRAEVTSDAGAASHERFLAKHVEKGSRLLTDGTNRISGKGYAKESVAHRAGEYVRGDVHVNAVESFWAHVKRSLRGTHKAVSQKYLQAYLDGFSWHRNNRRSDTERFAALLGVLLRRAA
jgi:transposase